MNVLVTGATGHLGAHLVREALADGHRVRALARPTSNLEGLEGLDVEIATGDILDPESLIAAMDGIELVLHAAAVHRMFTLDPDDIVRPAVDGTNNVVRAAAAAGVKRLVHTSSNATIGYPRDGTAWDESHFMENAHSPYIRGKCESEALALELGRELDIEVVVVNPCGILGPYDHRLTPTTKAVIGMTTGDPAVLGFAPTHAADLARGHLLAAEKGVPGERYILAGDNLSNRDVAEIMTELTGKKVRAMVPPAFLVRLIAWNHVRRAKKTGEDVPITPETVRDAWGSQLHYDSTKAKTQLGWSSRPGRQVIAETLTWLADRGHLAEPVAAHVRAHASAPE